MFFFSFSLSLSSNALTYYYHNWALGVYSLNVNTICQHISSFLQSMYPSNNVSGTGFTGLTCHFYISDVGSYNVAVLTYSTPCTGYIDSQGVCIECSGGEIINPYTDKCQQPCAVTSLDVLGTYPVAVLTPNPSLVCVEGCTKEVAVTVYNDYDSESGLPGCLQIDDSDPLAIVPSANCFQVTQRSNGAFCDSNVSTSLDLVVSDGSFDKTCVANASIIDGMCKCIQGYAQENDMCVRDNTQCLEGEHKDAFGNCIAVSCPDGTEFDPVTATCADQQPPACSTGQHREGLICVDDDLPQSCPDGTHTEPGCANCVPDGSDSVFVASQIVTVMGMEYRIVLILMTIMMAYRMLLILILMVMVYQMSARICLPIMAV